MLSKFAVALASIAVAASASEWQAQQPYAYSGYVEPQRYIAPQPKRVVRQVRRPVEQPYGNDYYRGSYQGEGIYAAPATKKDQIFLGLGYGYNYNVQPTYAYIKGEGYGIVDKPREHKPQIANDGYRVKKRTDPAIRQDATINAKCVLLDPEDESDVQGIISLTQKPKQKGTSVWGEFYNLGHDKLDLTINALGDLRDGCDSAGGVFNPSVSASGYGEGMDKKAPGILGEVKVRSHGYGYGYGYSAATAEFDTEADVDLAGTQSVIGRSMVLTASSGGKDDGYGNKTAAEETRIGCCVIGLAAGKKPEPKPVYVAPKPVYRPAYQPYQAREPVKRVAPVYQRQPSQPYGW